MHYVLKAMYTSTIHLPNIGSIIPWETIFNVQESPRRSRYNFSLVNEIWKSNCPKHFVSRPINSWDLCQIGIKLGAKHVIYQELANLM